MNIPRKFFVSVTEEEETIETARAILRKCHHVLTGGEMMMLERIVDELINDFPRLLLSIDEIHWFHSLQTQFAREIAEYKNQPR